jgi:hypothetical protein
MSLAGVRLATVTGLLDRWLVLFVLGATGLGLALPGPGRSADAHAGTPVALAVLVATAGARVEVSGLGRLRESWRPLAWVFHGWCSTPAANTRKCLSCLR